jgi:uncharacterized protein
MSYPFVYVQLQTGDAARARVFYEALFGWNCTVEPSGYTEIDVGSGPGGGILENAHVSPRWLAYVQVDDVGAATERARELGATVQMPPTVAPGKGTFSVLLDPTGAALALWTPQAR